MYANRGYLQGPLGSAQSLTSAANVAKFIAPEKMDVLEVSFEVTTLTSVTAAVISIYKRTSPTVTAGQVLLTTLTIPIGTVVGSVVYKSLEASLSQGQSLEFDVTTTATAGAGYSAAKVSFSSEDNRNLATAILSA